MTRIRLNLLTQRPWWRQWWPVLLLAGIKLLIHLLTNTSYGFHRDEFLYLDEARHLSWGFLEVPPLTPFLGQIALLMGGSLFAVRLLPALAGTVSVILVGLMTRDLGSSRWAQAVACTAFVFSPAFLGSNSLFQPVTFNQFFWLLTAFFAVRLIRRQEAKYWYWLGLAIGLGWLAKYSIAFFALALAVPLLIRERQWLRTPHPYLGALLGLAIAAPNLFWQWRHAWPVVAHMEELSRTQLVHVDITGFLFAQLRYHGAGLLVWAAGLVFLFYNKKMRSFRPLAWAFLLVMVLLILLRGKAYYGIGAYSMLMAAGGVAWIHWLQPYKKRWRYALIVSIPLLNGPLIPYSLPVLPIETMRHYGIYMASHWGFTGPLTWEDGKVRDLKQDYADMFGWEELAQKVARLYHGLPAQEQEHCLIWGGSYVHAGVLNYYGEKYGLPEAVSLNSSYRIWAPDTLHFDRVILVDDVYSTESSWFHESVLVDSIRHPLARDPGLIYYRHEPRKDVKQAWREAAAEAKARFKF
jgi:hypothetical protein